MSWQPHRQVVSDLEVQHDHCSRTARHALEMEEPDFFFHRNMGGQETVKGWYWMVDGESWL